MFNLLKANLLKHYYETKNNKSRFFFGISANVLILYTIYIFDNGIINSYFYKQYIYFYTLIWFVFSTTTYVGDNIISELKTGTLEQLLMSKYGLTLNLIFRFIFQFFKSIIFLSIVLLILNLFTDKTNLINLIPILIIFLIGFFSLYGIGLIIACIAIISKDIGYISIVFKIAIIALLFKFEKNLFIPFSYTNSLLKDTIINSIPLNLLNRYDLILAALNSLLFLVIGMIIFYFSLKRILNKGILIG